MATCRAPRAHLPGDAGRAGGFIEPTAVRRISYAGSLAFERIHEAEYRRLGFGLVDVPAGTVAGRAAAVGAQITAWAAGG